MRIHSLHYLLALVAVWGLTGTGSVLAGQASNNECPVGLVAGDTLDDEFGEGTSDITTCLKRRHNVKIVMQLNKSCRDSYVEGSKVVNNIANCDIKRAYALGNLRNMIKDYEETNGMAQKDYQIKVVVHSGGGYLLVKDVSLNGDGVETVGRNKFQSQVEDLMDMGVKFYFCQNTTRGFIRNGTLPAGDATAQLIDGVEYVTAGVTAIADLQAQGYKYVQP